MLQPLLRRPQSSLRAAASIANGLRSRSIHSMPQLRFDRHFEENGIPGFMSPDVFKLSWTDYQRFLINKLNLLTEDSTFATMDTLTLVKTYAKERRMAPVFNYASMAHNNHFFFNGLSPIEVPMPKSLAADLAESGSSPESMKQDFLAAASAQFGGGFVWLVSQHQRGLFKIVCTYNAGTPYSEAFARQQPVDMNTEPVRKAGGWYDSAAFPDQGGHVNVAPGGIQVTPLLCVNTWEHAWLYDYGFDGKDEYLERWWDKIDWNLVENAHKQTPGYNARLNSRTF